MAMQSRDEVQDVVESSTPPPAEYSQTVRLCPDPSGGTRKQTGLAGGQRLLLVANGLQQGTSEPHC